MQEVPDCEGWIVTKDRFFAIGTWHVPGYVFTQGPEVDSLTYVRNESLYECRGCDKICLSSCRSQAPL
ncbi:hypothetical protein KCV26_10170 [Petrimonas sulfuriphila]|jgi:hypothetical protein|uniref:hypothetical protein n=1 Tax=Petrimonas sulfuriphila TaxID=285070 RepID=UPI003254498F